MDEDLAIIAQSTRKEQIKNFFNNHKKKIYFFISFALLSIFLIFFYFDNVKKQKVKIANRFIKATLSYDVKKEKIDLNEFYQIIDTRDSTYAPLSLFFLLDNKFVESNKKINSLFDKVINDVKLDKEIKNLVIYKKALFNFDTQNENEMLKTLKPIINSESFWRPHSLLLLGDYFLFKGEKQKAKDFYSKIFNSKINNKNIYNQALQRVKNNYGE